MQAAIYEAKLNEAVRLLVGVGRGRCESTRYDPRYWELGTDPNPDTGPGLKLLPGIRPSTAIDEMFANVERWSFDCAQFMEVLQLYALRHALGGDTFDARAKNLELRVHESTGVWRKTYMARQRWNLPFTRSDGTLDRRPLADVLSALPIGALIVWHNRDPDLPARNALKNENTLKVGDNRYATHGLGYPSVRSRNGLELSYAEHVFGRELDPNEAIVYIQQNIFVWEVITYVTPNNP